MERKCPQHISKTQLWGENTKHQEQKTDTLTELKSIEGKNFSIYYTWYRKSEFVWGTDIPQEKMPVLSSWTPS